MNPSIITRPLVIVLMLSLGGAFFYATYNAIDNIVAEQSRVQQETVSPVYELVRDELLRPLYIAETFASSVDFTTTMDSTDLDEEALLRQLQDMELDLGLKFFVASERTRKQYFSDGSTLNLIEGEVAWYFEAMANEKDILADLGQVGDVHLYFDVKVYSSDREFLGYVGVGKPIRQFVETFDRYKARYGYDFLFVNDRNEIILTSLPEFVVTDAYIPTLESLEWFDHGDSSASSHDSEVIEVDKEDFLISEFGIEQLGWRLLLLTPLDARQAQTMRAFMISAVTSMVSVSLLAMAVFGLMLLYKQNLEKKTEVDLLTGLPNRNFIERRYAQLQREGGTICAIIVDLDHFKTINDTYGHDAGDRVLKAAATVFGDVLRDKDIVGRWGGEEFVMLLPARSVATGKSIAERARRRLEGLTIELRETSVSITASFGVAFGPGRDESLADLLARADKVLYEAKETGRNQVKLCREAAAQALASPPDVARG
ncbi:MAG: sensor domain-containing diguanylate cyclase [Woeseiaceae bacterium]|nr:sensor domain-containing diguanylate cyclase [Woeseiaceae bacterium]